MRTRILTLVTLLALAFVSTAARAAAWDAKQVPGKAQWVLHVDFDTVRGTQMWTWLQPKLQADPKYARGLREVEALGGLNAERDLHDVTIYGTSAEEKDNVVIIGAKADQPRLKQMVSLAEGFAAEPYAGREIYTWQDKGKTMFGAFPGDARIVLSQNKDLVRQALDLAAGKGQSLQNAPLPGGQGGGAGVVMTLTGTGLTELLRAKDPRSPLIGQLQSAWLELSEQAGQVTLRGKAQAKDAQAAERIRTTLEGVKAFVSLAGLAEQADEKARLAGAAIEKAKVTSRDATVELDWRLPVADVQAFLAAADPKFAR